MAPLNILKRTVLSKKYVRTVHLEIDDTQPPLADNDGEADADTDSVSTTTTVSVMQSAMLPFAQAPPFP